MGSMSLRAKPACCFFGRLFCFICFFSAEKQASKKSFAGFTPFASIFLSRASSLPAFGLLWISIQACRILSKTKSGSLCDRFLSYYIYHD